MVNIIMTGFGVKSAVVIPVFYDVTN